MRIRPHSGSKFPDSFGRINCGAASHCHQSIRPVLQELLHSVRDLINRGIRHNIGIDFILCFALLQRTGNQINHPALYHKGVSNNQNTLIGHVRKSLQRTLSKVNLCFYTKGFHIPTS